VACAAPVWDADVDGADAEAEPEVEETGGEDTGLVDVGVGVVDAGVLTGVVELTLLDVVETGFVEPLLCLVELAEKDPLLELKQSVGPAGLCQIWQEKKIAEGLPAVMVKGAEFCGAPVLSLMVRRQFVPAGRLVSQVSDVLERVPKLTRMDVWSSASTMLYIALSGRQKGQRTSCALLQSKSQGG
jgi:hypothetical protein